MKTLFVVTCGVLAVLVGRGADAAVTPSVASVSTPNVTQGKAVTPGGPVTDFFQAIVGSSGAIVTGTVTFFLCPPSLVTPGQGCVSGGKQIGAAKSLDFNVLILTGSHATSDPASGADTIEPGTYCWRTEYSGASNLFNPTTHTNFDTECFIVAMPNPAAQQVPTLSTWGMILLAASLAGGAARLLVRPSSRPTSVP
jgi:hypothetical protein